MISRSQRLKTLGLMLAGSFVLVLSFLTMPVSVAQAEDGDPPPPPDDCAACHTEAYEAWDAGPHANTLTDPRYIDAWNQAGSPGYCKSCHATGYLATEGTVDYEGVGCLACHTDEEGNHPASDMTVDNSPEQCAKCHTGSHAPDYEQWKESTHVVANIGCADCHQSHDTTLRLETPNQLCSSCHQDADQGLHAEQGASCTDCHMARGETIIDPLSGTTNGTGHSFEIPPSVCATCHDMTHKLTGEDVLTETDVAVTSVEQDGQASDPTKQHVDLGMTVGGTTGLIIGLLSSWLLYRRTRHASED